VHASQIGPVGSLFICGNCVIESLFSLFPPFYVVLVARLRTYSRLYGNPRASHFTHINTPFYFNDLGGPLVSTLSVRMEIPQSSL
jgi:hypothetical protein